MGNSLFFPMQPKRVLELAFMPVKELRKTYIQLLRDLAEYRRKEDRDELSLSEWGSNAFMEHKRGIIEDIAEQRKINL